MRQKIPVQTEPVEALPSFSRSGSTERKTALRQAQGKRSGGNESLRFAGYAAIFNEPDRGGDVIRPGAFERARGEVPLLWQHDRDQVIGQIEMLEEDRRGLRVIARLHDTKLAEGLESGALGGLSFGYRVRDGGPGENGLRELLDLDLVEVSLVTIPMQPLARVHAVAN